MLKLILKNLWARRWRNGWLFAELIVVSAITWSVIDPVVVDTWVQSLPMGYDSDRMCMVSVAKYPAEAPLYRAENDSTVKEDFLRLSDVIRQMPDVAYATPLPTGMYLHSHNQRGITLMSDTTRKVMGYLMPFIQGTDYFETFGIRPSDGQSLSEATGKAQGSNQLIITEGARSLLFEDGNINRPLTCVAWRDTTEAQVAGVVADMKYFKFWRPTPVFFKPIHAPEETTTIMLRLKDGINVDGFIDWFYENQLASLGSGNLYVSGIQSFDKYIDDYTESMATQYHLNITLAMFFMLSLCLGVIGAFWLQTKTRKGDLGVMKAYGASKGNIMSMLIGEGWVLTTVAWIVGCFIYWNYARMEELYTEIFWSSFYPSPSWLDSFSLHFTITSLVLYVVMILVVLAGIYIPARNISRILPSEALRDE